MFLATDPSLQLRIGGFQWFPPVPFPGFRGVGGILLIWSDDSMTPPSSCLGEASKACLTQREAVFHCSLSLCTSEAHTGRSLAHACAAHLDTASTWNGHSQYLEWNLLHLSPGFFPLFSSVKFP